MKLTLFATGLLGGLTTALKINSWVHDYEAALAETNSESMIEGTGMLMSSAMMSSPEMGSPDMPTSSKKK